MSGPPWSSYTCSWVAMPSRPTSTGPSSARLTNTVSIVRLPWGSTAVRPEHTARTPPAGAAAGDVSRRHRCGRVPSGSTIRPFRRVLAARRRPSPVRAHSCRSQSGRRVARTARHQRRSVGSVLVDQQPERPEGVLDVRRGHRVPEQEALRLVHLAGVLQTEQLLVGLDPLCDQRHAQARHEHHLSAHDGRVNSRTRPNDRRTRDRP